MLGIVRPESNASSLLVELSAGTHGWGGEAGLGKLGQLTCRRWDPECWAGMCPGFQVLFAPLSGSHKGHTRGQTQ